MNAILQRIHDIGVVAWVRIVQALNWIALTLAGGVVTIDAMYHDEVSKALGGLPPVVKLAAFAAWSLIVHYGLRRAAKSA